MATLLDSTDLTARLTAAPRPWRRVDIHDVVDSTNTVAAAHAAQDGQPWTLVAADHQSGGRGRQGREWVSPPGTSISLSMVVPLGRPRAGGRVAAGPAGRVGWLPLITGLAVARTLGRFSRRRDAFALKWPNDVLGRPVSIDAAGAPGAAGEPGAARLPEHKVCGILCQSLWSTGEPLAVVGIGINVTVPADQLPVPNATSLADCCAGPVPTREHVIVALADEFVRWHERFTAGGVAMEEIRSAYDVACATLGAHVQVHLPGGRVMAGRAERVDAQGRLIVREGLDVAAEPRASDGPSALRTVGSGGSADEGGEDFSGWESDAQAGQVRGAGRLHALAAGDVIHIRREV